MAVRVGHPKDAIAGALFIVIGAGAWFGAQRYRIGTATHMGPGYFPQYLGALLVLLGMLSLLRGLRGTAATDHPTAQYAIAPLLLVLAGVIGFYLLIDRAGLVPAIGVLIGFACAPQLLRRPLEVLAIFLVLAGFAVAVFIHGFGMPLHAF